MLFPTADESAIDFRRTVRRSVLSHLSAPTGTRFRHCVTPLTSWGTASSSDKRPTVNPYTRQRYGALCTPVAMAPGRSVGRPAEWISTTMDNVRRCASRLTSRLSRCSTGSLSTVLSIFHLFSCEYQVLYEPFSTARLQDAGWDYW